MRWASEQVEIYAETFRRQVYGADQDGKVIQESLEVTKGHGAMVSPSSRPLCSLANTSPPQLRDVGLDFTFLLDGLLRPQPSETAPPIARAVDHLRPGGGKSAVAIARQSIFMNQAGGEAKDAGGRGARR